MPSISLENEPKPCYITNRYHGKQDAEASKRKEREAEPLLGQDKGGRKFRIDHLIDLGKLKLYGTPRGEFAAHSAACHSGDCHGVRL